MTGIFLHPFPSLMFIIYDTLLNINFVFYQLSILFREWGKYIILLFNVEAIPIHPNPIVERERAFGKDRRKSALLQLTSFIIGVTEKNASFDQLNHLKMESKINSKSKSPKVNLMFRKIDDHRTLNQIVFFIFLFKSNIHSQSNSTFGKSCQRLVKSLLKVC